MLEKENKYLVDYEKFINEGYELLSSKVIKQAYINICDDSETRVRIVDDKIAFITIKLNTKTIGVREEFEYEIPLNDAKILFEKFKHQSTIKNRMVFAGGYMTYFELDFFIGNNYGLTLLEIEKIGNRSYRVPKSIIEDVTKDKKYYNKYLSLNPFKNWKD